ncbi:MAG TPA: hypothetical protein VGK39_03055 [Cyclobacteriaceae bacterium]
MLCGKRIFETKGEAAESLKELKVKSKGTGSVYFCDDCQAWHISSGGQKRGGKKRKKFKNMTDTEELNIVNKQNKKSGLKNQILHIKKYGA